MRKRALPVDILPPPAASAAAAAAAMHAIVPARRRCDEPIAVERVENAVSSFARREQAAEKTQNQTTKSTCTSPPTSTLLAPACRNAAARNT